MVDAEASKNRVSSSVPQTFTVALGQIPALSSTLAFSEKMCLLTTVASKSLNNSLSRIAETIAALERMRMLSQWEIAIAQNGQKVQLSEPSLLSLSMRTFGSEIL